ncbi:DUF4105 domain-containing protein [Bacteriovorax sp. Seq25_V]|uniref:DUF7844 domain-containing protein n=1 Tax=Bacteriovorax sp. Seq25_V TaxID=1201288 RepID=UPI00038A133B|nr:DUF4105 domain-containing protein [Bacteriovorax sp. Seq25_V]EQC45623.1 PF13387 domain protein [Bacteriovorax sp. Seq25_V]
MLKKLLVATLLIQPVFSMKIELKASKDVTNVATDFIVETLKPLPYKIKKVLSKKTLSVEFVDLNKGFKGLPDPCAASGFKYGNYKLGKIKLDKRLIQVIKDKNTDKEFDCKHGNFYQLTKASLLHEIAHAYDNKFLWVKRASNDKELRALGFWDTEAILNKNYNTFHKRSPDDYEYEKRKEFFAVNFEYFFLDKEFKCRRPTLYNYYSKELGATPFKNFECKTNDEINLTTDNGVMSVSVNKNKIKEVQFLFAAEGPQMMSKWGHSMFKLIVCKDEGDSLEECRKNSREHVVISFLAYVDDISIDAVKGVFGAYPSRMLVSDLGAIKRQYTRGEFRSLKALPIKFNETQRERFLNHLLRVYWEYAGRYYFFTNNCADEAFKLIQLAINEESVYKDDVVTPLGLYKYLNKTGLTDETILEDRKAATSNGYYYPSFGDSLNKVYSALKVNLSDIAWPENVEEYTKLHPLTRREIISDALALVTEKKEVFSLIGIEGHGQYLDGLKVITLMTDFKTIDSLGDDFKKMLEETVELKNVYLYGTTVKELGYGIPLEGDFSSDDTTLRDDSDKQRDEILARVREEIKRVNTTVFERYENALENMTLIKSKLKDL